jgi:hypothetical protein
MANSTAKIRAKYKIAVIIKNIILAPAILKSYAYYFSSNSLI